MQIKGSSKKMPHKLAEFHNFLDHPSPMSACQWWRELYLEIQFHQLAIIATVYILVLEKDSIVAPLRKILIHWAPQNKDIMSFTFQKNFSSKMSVIWKLQKFTGFICCMLISMSEKKQVTTVVCWITEYCCCYLNFSGH